MAFALPPPEPAVVIHAELAGTWEDDPSIAPPETTADAPRTSWRALRSNEARFASACFDAPLDHGWPAEEAEPLALEKLEAIAATTATRAMANGSANAAGVAWRMDDVKHAGNIASRDLSADGVRARVILGFRADAPDLVACYAVCVRGACDDAVDHAKLEGPLGPAPDPSVATRAVVWSVHHPASAGATFALAAVALGALAIHARRRPPRSRER